MAVADTGRIPFPLEFVIEGTPVAARGSNSSKAWMERVAQAARGRLDELTEWAWLEEQPLSVSIFYFPQGPMQGDIDNIVKHILDAMNGIAYRDDSAIERALVQRFEPGLSWSFSAMSPILVRALERAPPVVYIKVESDLGWRQVA